MGRARLLRRTRRRTAATVGDCRGDCTEAIYNSPSLAAVFSRAETVSIGPILAGVCLGVSGSVGVETRAQELLAAPMVKRESVSSTVASGLSADVSLAICVGRSLRRLAAASRVR